MLKSYPERNSSQTARPKLYFCAHPEDVDLYLKPIADEILKKQPGVTFWYDNTVVDEVSESHALELNSMQVFVVPITNKFLSTPNRGLDDFRYAVERKIPILPLLQEPGLESKFNNTCGNFQILDKNKVDSTAISYEVKLERFLKTHIISEDMVEELRKAFCAFVFISYRKKDRFHVQELMKAIHSIDAFKDIGVWYDEFLVAGEPFDEIIKKSIDRSNFILFAVTDNFLEDGNYIQKKPDGEYLYSKSKDKAMIPVQICDIDRVILEEKYEDFPKCIKNSPKEIETAIESQLKRLSIEHKPDDILHTYMLGLAYINGIHVETDKQRGINYIESAYYNDQEIISIVPEASKTLAEIYYWGNGTSTDYVKSATFQLEYCKYLLSKSDSVINDELIVRELCWLADICLEPLNGDRSRLVSKRNAVEAYREACERCEKIIASGNSSDEILNYYITSCSVLAELLYEASYMYEDIEDKRAIFKECEANYRKHISILESNPDIHNAIPHGRFLDKSYAYFSFARHLPGMAVDEDDRTKKIEDSIDLFVKAASSEDSLDVMSRVRIVSYYESIAGAYYFLGKHELAIKYYEKIVTIHDGFPKKHKSYYTVMQSACRALSEIVEILYVANKKQEAKEYIKKLALYSPIWKRATEDGVD